MERIAVFVGSFDPFTRGHLDIAKRALTLFDKLIIALGVNASKHCLFTEQSRIEIIHDALGEENRFEVRIFNGLTAQFCQAHKAKFLIRGLRSGSDFDYEKTIAQANAMLAPELETVFLMTRPEHAAISSTVVRDILLHGGDASQFLPPNINIAKYLPRTPQQL